MAARRISVLVTTIALALAGLAAVAGPAGADGVITPSATSVPVGGSLTVEPTGCDLAVDDDETYTYQNAQISFVTDVGGVERAIAVGVGDGGGQIAIPGWVDPDAPAVLRGACIETRYRWGEGTRETVTAFTYPEVAIDITPAESDDVRLTTLVLDRDTAAGGQVVEAQVSGCLPGEEVQVSVVADTDLSLGGTPRYVAGDYAMAVDGPTAIEIPLLDQYSGELVADGDYVVVAACYAYAGTGSSIWMAEPTWLYVRGAAVVGTMSVDADPAAGGLVISGDGCTDRPVSVRIRGNEYGLEDGQIDDTLAPLVAADGTWTASWSTEAIGFSVQIGADCGDPRSDGFRYPPQHWYENGYSDQWIGRVSPTSTPVGGHVQVHVEGNCDDPTAVVQLRDDQGNTLSEGTVMAGALEGNGSAHLMAPDEPGTYQLVALCDGRPSYPDSIEVFAPTPVAPTRPLPAGPGSGWPQTGAREQFHGEIGPITLPAEHDHEMPGADGGDSGGGASPAGLGPSGLGIAVPRPAGDFAITSLTFDLVDEHGNSVSTDDAHLHHMVVANLSAANPACPGGTFGLPGEIIAAAGAERTAIGFGDPYGLLVEESDAWAGVYEVMNMADEEQTVFLTYDMEIRRDIENVRPVSTYFGSATGCGSFTWTIDGSGSPDQQAHYLTVANDGVLVGAGGHLHNGGLHTELYDDRGRLLCRNELVLGETEEPTPTTTTMPDHGTTTTMHDHGTTTTTMHDHGTTTTTMHDHDTTTTTMMHDDGETTETTMVEWPTGPPEMYPDDPPLEAITPCRTHEQVTAGERLLFQATYANDRPRSGVMGIFLLYVWEGGGPSSPRGPGTRPPLGSDGPTGPGTPTTPTTSTPTTRPGGTSTTTPVGPGGPPGPVDPDDPTRPTDPPTTPGSGAPSSPSGVAAGAGSGRPTGVAGESATPARPAAAARPYRGSASYTG